MVHFFFENHIKYEVLPNKKAQKMCTLDITCKKNEYEQRGLQKTFQKITKGPKSGKFLSSLNIK